MITAIAAELGTLSIMSVFFAGITGLPFTSDVIPRGLTSKFDDTDGPTLGGYEFWLPAETDPHDATIMTWPTARSTGNNSWPNPGGDINATRYEIAAVAKAIAKYEPVEMFVLDPAVDSAEIDGKNGSSYESAMKLLGQAKNITMHVITNVDSLWARDIGPVFTYARVSEDSGDNVLGREDFQNAEVTGTVLHFNQWGQKLFPTVDSYFAGAACEMLNYTQITAQFVAEGGGIEFDGEGTLLATESALLNPNRNPGVDKATLEAYFGLVFGIQKTLWIPGVRDADITDDHIDGIARFAPNGKILVTKPFVPEGEDESEYLADFNDIVDLLL